MSRDDTPMQRQVRNLPSIIKEQFKDLEPKTRKLFTTEEIYSFKSIILTGCGDSYAACLAVQSAFEDFARVPVETVTAIDLARHYSMGKLEDGPNSPLIISVSNSGDIARVAEGVIRANTTSSYTLGVTANPNSLLGKNVKNSLYLNLPKLDPCPGVASYGISLLALLLLAIRIGEVKLSFTMDHANLLRNSLIEGMDEIGSRIKGIEKQLMHFSDIWSKYNGFDFIGSGSDYASVFYGQAKIIEAAGRYAMHINTEEWLHLNFFLRDSEVTGTVLIINHNNSGKSRALEVLKYIQENKRPLLVITDDKDFIGEDYEYVEVPKTLHESFSPLFQFLPLAILASVISQQIGEEYGRGAVGNWALCRNGRAVKESKIVILED